MNYTENYQLPQWEETDRVLMENFNDAMEKMDDGLLSLKENVPTNKLLDFTLAQDALSFSIDVSNIEFPIYREVQIVITAKCNTEISMCLNGDSEKNYALSYYGNGGGQTSYNNTYMARIPAVNNVACGVLLSVVPAENRNVIFQNMCIACNGYGAYYYCGIALSSSVQWQNLQTLDFSSESQILTGSRVTIFGTK